MDYDTAPTGLFFKLTSPKPKEKPNPNSSQYLKPSPSSAGNRFCAGSSAGDNGQSKRERRNPRVPLLRKISALPSFTKPRGGNVPLPPASLNKHQLGYWVLFLRPHLPHRHAVRPEPLPVSPPATFGKGEISGGPTNGVQKLAPRKPPPVHPPPKPSGDRAGGHRVPTRVLPHPASHQENALHLRSLHQETPAFFCRARVDFPPLVGRDLLSRHGVVGRMVGLDDLRGLLQPMIL